MTPSPSSPALGAGALFAGNDDTIVAVATPPGRGALALIRVSGPSAHTIGRALSTRWPSSPRVATRTAIHDQQQALLDQAVIVRYDAPASYTGEDAFEITTHGGSVVPTTIVAEAVAHGARLALPGEFSRRAVLNGKIDLLQAEAAGDLVDATSRAAQRVALQQLDGGLSRRITELRSWLVTTEALLAYEIDFPEEDDGPLPADRILETLTRSEQSLDDLLATTRAGELVRQGALVVFAGVPNAGKSSLFNALLGQQRAIVTAIPGTTRDAIEAVIDVGRWPLRLVDTAGLRQSADPVERLGVATSERYLAEAAVILVCGEILDDLRAATERVGVARAPVIMVGTKSDLGRLAEAELAPFARAHGAAASLLVSAEQGTALAALTDAIMRVLDAGTNLPTTDAPLLTHVRHRHIIGAARNELAEFRRAWRVEGLPATVAAVHLRTAVTALEELIGSVEIEQILDEVFRRFCVGK